MKVRNELADVAGVKTQKQLRHYIKSCNEIIEKNEAALLSGLDNAGDPMSASMRGSVIAHTQLMRAAREQALLCLTDPKYGYKEDWDRETFLKPRGHFD